MQYVTRLPRIALRPFIRYYWRLEIQPQDVGEQNRIIPGIGSDLIFQFGAPARYAMHEESWQVRRPVGFIECGFTRPFLLNFTHPAILYGVRFTTTGLAYVVDEPLHEFQNMFVDPGELFTPFGDNLTDQLYAAGTPYRAAHILDLFFTQRLAKFKHKDRQMQIIVQYLGLNADRSDINHITARTGMGAGRLERNFRAYTGMSLAYYRSTVRVRQAMKHIASGRCINIQTDAHTTGYRDATSLSSEFREVTGFTPEQYITESLPIHSKMLASESAFT